MTPRQIGFVQQCESIRAEKAAIKNTFAQKDGDDNGNGSQNKRQLRKNGATSRTLRSAQRIWQLQAAAVPDSGSAARSIGWLKTQKIGNVQHVPRWSRLTATVERSVRWTVKIVKNASRTSLIEETRMETENIALPMRAVDQYKEQKQTEVSSVYRRRTATPKGLIAATTGKNDENVSIIQAKRRERH